MDLAVEQLLVVADQAFDVLRKAHVSRPWREDSSVGSIFRFLILVDEIEVDAAAPNSARRATADLGRLPLSLRHLVVAVALFLPSCATYAQHPLILSRLSAWNAATPLPDATVLKAEISKRAQAIYGNSTACSGSDILIDQAEPASADRYAFAAILQGAIKNAWFVSVRMTGCDAAPVRYMIIRNSDDSLKTIRVNRGKSYAWDSLIGDTLPAVQVAAVAALKRKNLDCSGQVAPTLGVMRIGSEEAGLGPDVYGTRYAGTWTEVWQIIACDRTVEVSIRFTADGDGGAYTNIPGEQVRIVS